MSDIKENSDRWHEARNKVAIGEWYVHKKHGRFIVMEKSNKTVWGINVDYQIGESYWLGLDTTKEETKTKEEQIARLFALAPKMLKAIENYLNTMEGTAEGERAYSELVRIKNEAKRIS